ncbi:MAG: hypothetical protein ACD_58C00005G0002 [uncultured bacterium]|nr:MAG: hypothetical protein ACD_58C00005G0002 [uncultured bacterium]
MSKPDLQLTCNIDRIENDKAVLCFFSRDNRQQLILSKKYLPKDSKEGDVFNVEFLSESQLTTKNKNLAQEILKEILNGK